jgi:RNA polymerase sigma-70 factor (ECF subfamily)
MDHAHVAVPPLSLETDFEPFFSQRFSSIFNYLARLTGDVAVATRIAPEAFRTLRKTMSGKAREGADVLLYRAATEQARELRMAAPWRRRPANGKSSVELDALTLQPLKRDTVQRALEALPFGQRALLLLRDYIGLSYAEIAGVLLIPEKQIAQRLEEARAEYCQVYAYIKF